MMNTDDIRTPQPMVSVVTVCRNALPLLQQTVASVAAQTFTDYEHIIVDGASADGTTEYLQHLDMPRLSWLSEPDNGIYDAMNKAVKQCNGRWVVFMNAGDRFFADDTLQHVFCRPYDDDVAVIYGDVYKEGRGVVVAEPPHNAHRMYFCHQSAFIRTALLRSHPYDVSHPYSADFKFFKTRLLAGDRFVQLPLAIANFDTGGVSATRRGAGISDNIRVVREVDSLWWQCRLLPRLYFQLFMCKIRPKR